MILRCFLTHIVESNKLLCSRATRAWVKKNLLKLLRSKAHSFRSQTLILTILAPNCSCDKGLINAKRINDIWCFVLKLRTQNRGRMNSTTNKKKNKKQFSNEHRLTSVNPIEISLLFMNKGHQRKAYFSRIDWNESLVPYLHWFDWQADISQKCEKKGANQTPKVAQKVRKS